MKSFTVYTWFKIKQITNRMHVFFIHCISSVKRSSYISLILIHYPVCSHNAQCTVRYGDVVKGLTKHVAALSKL